MKKFALWGLTLLFVISSTVIAQPPDNFYTIKEIYLNADSLVGDTVFVLAFYSTPRDSLIMDIGWTIYQKEPFPPQSVGILDGVPPAEVWYGGLMYIEGIVNFVPRTEHFYPEDTIMLHLDMLSANPVFEGDTALGRAVPYEGSEDESETEAARSEEEVLVCDSCKFALLISGGVDAKNFSDDFWYDLEEAYATKVNNEGYCPSNIFIAFYHGEPLRTTVIDTSQAHLNSATTAHIKSYVDSIARRIAACKRAGKKTEFQKIVSNHGAKGPPAGTCLLGDVVIPPETLMRWEQEIIDSGCDRMIDLFTHCFAGYMVDSLKKLNPGDSCEITITSAVDHRVSWGPTTRPHRFNKSFMDSIKRGHSPNRAAVEAKLAYDEYIRNVILPYLHRKMQRLMAAYIAAPSGSKEEDTLIGKYVQAMLDSEEAYNSICESPIVKIIKMRTFCQLETVWVPPGGQLVLDFKGDPSNCGNVTVWMDSAGHRIRKKQWNFNLTGGGVRRVTNARSDSITMFVIHNDDNSYSITATSIGSHRYDVTPENRIDYAVISFGGIDCSGTEFGYYPGEVFEVFGVDEMGFDLTTMPSVLGGEGVQTLIVHFNPPGPNDYWSDMEVFIVVSEVLAPGELEIQCDAAEHSLVGLYIDEPGIYTAYLGSISVGKSPFDLVFTASGSFEWDSWALRSIVPTGVEEDHRWVNTKPCRVALHQNYPQPFNSSTTIEFDLPDEMRVKLDILDVIGRVVMMPVEGVLPMGHHSVRVDLEGQPAGMYFYRLTTPEGVYVRRMSLVK